MPLLSNIFDIPRYLAYPRDMQLRDIGAAVREARSACGLTQAELAVMVGVSRATINALEQGTGDTVASTILRVCDLLGVRLQLKAAPAKRDDALQWAAASASTSYRTQMHGRDLQAALTTGQVPTEFAPHLSYVVSELSDTRLLHVVRAVAARTGQPPKRVWRNAAHIAQELMSPHPRWLHAEAR